MLKPNHIPVVWDDAPVEPFKFDPQKDKNSKMKRYFVQVRATFRDGVYVVEEVLEKPTKKIPKFLKPFRKKDIKRNSQRLLKKQIQYSLNKLGNSRGFNKTIYLVIWFTSFLVIWFFVSLALSIRSLYLPISPLRPPSPSPSPLSNVPWPLKMQRDESLLYFWPHHLYILLP